LLQIKPMKSPLYAALDLHSRYSVLGSMDHDGRTQPRMRFPTEANILRAEVERLRRKRRPLYLTMEAGALTRWASAIVRPVVDRLIICEPRHNRLINTNPTKSDEADVEGMCLLLRLGKLKEVWMGQDRTREIYRALVYELLNWRDAQRELRALIKARYRGWGVLRLHGIKVFSAKGRQKYLEQLPAEEERRMMSRLYRQFDHALLQWKETFKEVERIGAAFWEVRQFQRIPGVGPIAAHVFSAIIEQPERFGDRHQLWKYSQLAITDRTSDNKPLGYQRQRSARESRTQKPLLSRLAYRVQIDHGTKCHQELLSAKPVTHRKCASCPAQHSAQNFGNDVDDLAATPTL